MRRPAPGSGSHLFPLTATTVDECPPFLAPPPPRAVNRPRSTPCAPPPLLERFPRLTAVIYSRRLRDPRAQSDALRRLPNSPYKREGPGALYIHVRIAPTYLPDYLALFRLGALPTPALLDNLDLLTALGWLEGKLGETRDVDRRMGEYDRCRRRGNRIDFHGCYFVPERLRTGASIRFSFSLAHLGANSPERLIHLRLATFGAKSPVVECVSCLVKHREYASLHLAGGLHGFLKIIEDVLAEGNAPIVL
jgi:hypothetical protein